LIGRVVAHVGLEPWFCPPLILATGGVRVVIPPLLRGLKSHKYWVLVMPKMNTIVYALLGLAGDDRLSALALFKLRAHHLGQASSFSVFTHARNCVLGMSIYLTIMVASQETESRFQGLVMLLTPESLVVSRVVETNPPLDGRNESTRSRRSHPLDFVLRGNLKEDRNEGVMTRIG